MEGRKVSIDPLKLAAFIWQVVTTLVASAAFVVSWWGNRQRANKSALDRVERQLSGSIEAVKQELQNENEQIGSRLDEHHERITIAEQALKYAPKAEDLEKLRHSIQVLSENVARAESSQRVMERTVERIHQYLMEREK